MTGTYAYDAFGAVRAQSDAATEWSCTGEQNDPTGLEYLRARYYDKGTGRFLSQDPVPLLQRYGYANDNPANLVDPSGLSTAKDAQDALVARFEQLMAAERKLQAIARQILADPCWKTHAFCKHVAFVWKKANNESRKGARWAADQWASVWYGQYYAAYETLGAINDLPGGLGGAVHAAFPGVVGGLIVIEVNGLVGNTIGDAVEKYIGGKNEALFDDHRVKPVPCFVPGARRSPGGGCTKFLPGLGQDPATRDFGHDFNF